MLNILIVDDHPVYRQGLRCILESIAGTRICHEAENGREAIERCEQSGYDVVFMDISMPVMNGIEASRILKKLYPDMSILILSMYNAKHQVIELLEMNIDAYLMKGLDKDEIIKALEYVTGGRQYMTQDIQSIYHEYTKARKSKADNYHFQLFSNREIEVIRWLCKGFSAKSIGEFMGISESTVNNHRSHIMKKMQADTVVNVVNYAYKHGIAIP